MPAVGEHLTAKYKVNNVFSNIVDESSLSRLDPDKKLKLDEQDSIILNSTSTSARAIIELPIKTYVKNLHRNSRN